MAGLSVVRIVIAAVAALIVGALWYMPFVMGARWARLVNQYVRIPEQELLNPKNPLSGLGLWLIVALVNSVAMAYLVQAASIASIGGAIVLALVVWAGFGLTFGSWPVIFARQPTGLWLVNGGALLLMQLVTAIVLVV